MSVRWSLWILVEGLLSGCSDREQASMADGRLTAAPAGIEFQRVAVFDQHEMLVTLRNVGRSRIEVDDIWVEGANGGTYAASFTHEGPHRLLPGSECQLKVLFSPSEPVDLTATLVIHSNAQREPLLSVPLRGTGVEAWASMSSWSTLP